MNELKQKLTSIIEDIQKVTEFFYQNRDEQGYYELNALIGKMVNIMNELSFYTQEHPDFDMQETKISTALSEAVQALEQKDTVLLADILQYDLLELFQLIKENIQD